MSAIEVDSLTKSYGQVKAVDGVSFTVERGEIFSLLGPNGAGKTTTIEILEGLRQRDGGGARVLGLDPWADGYRLHRMIGVIPQGFRFFDYPTPKESVRYYAELFGVKVDPASILKRVMLDDSADRYFSKLSGGQKQKVGLALSLVNDPEVLFLDEPTTGLDPQARRAVWDVIRNLKSEGRSVLLTTHYMEEAEELADRVAILAKGRIIAGGTPKEIIARYGSPELLTLHGDDALASYLRTNTGLDVTYDDGLISVHMREKHDALKTLAAIDASGLEWRDLSTKRDSLEDIFVKLVGSGAEAGTADGGSSE